MVYIFENSKQFFKVEHLILKSIDRATCHRDLTKTTPGQCQDTVGTLPELDWDTAVTQLGPVGTRSRLDWDIAKTRRTQSGHCRDMVGKFS